MVSTTMSISQSNAGKKVSPVSAKYNNVKFSRPCDESQKSPRSVDDNLGDIESLRARNKVLEAAMRSIKSCADEQFDKHHDLVWFAMNRCRYPNHEKSRELENSKELREDIKKLRGDHCDYFHGMNCGTFATSRLFKEIADVACVALETKEGTEQVIEKKVQDAKESFPNINLN